MNFTCYLAVETITYLLDFGITTAQVLDNIGHESEINHGGRLSQSSRCYIRHGPTDLFDNVLLSVVDLFLDDLKEPLRKYFSFHVDEYKLTLSRQAWVC